MKLAWINSRVLSAGICGILLFSEAGCTQTPGSLKTAEALGARISAYHKQQKDRVEQFNAEYRDRSNQLFDDLVTLSDRRLQQGRDGAAQTMADSLISDDSATLIGKVRKQFGSTLQDQMDAIVATDNAIAAARAAYSANSKEASVDLKKLEKLESDLTILATKESGSQVIEDALHVVTNAVDTHREIVKQMKKQPPSTSLAVK